VSTGVVRRTTELALFPCRALHDPGTWCQDDDVTRFRSFQVETIKTLIGQLCPFKLKRSKLWSYSYVPRGGMILLSTRSWYFIDRDFRDRVNFLDPRFEPRTKQYDISIGPGFNSQAILPVSDQCDSWPMSQNSPRYSLMDWVQLCQFVSLCIALTLFSSDDNMLL
jgi:hypothetical protein